MDAPAARADTVDVELFDDPVREQPLEGRRGRGVGAGVAELGGDPGLPSNRSLWWQATRRPGSPGTARSPGACSTQTAVADAQRGANGQPVNSVRGSGG
ncbi:hypothetical protein GCM10010341_47870 [Streptomyces noursei]|nr:hypothetical protein GCM10010341_47870 [Streptomyces noursei]